MDLPLRNKIAVVVSDQARSRRNPNMRWASLVAQGAAGPRQEYVVQGGALGGEGGQLAARRAIISSSTGGAGAAPPPSSRDHTFSSTWSHGSDARNSPTSRPLRTRRGSSHADSPFLNRISVRQSFFSPPTSWIW